MSNTTNEIADVQYMLARRWEHIDRLFSQYLTVQQNQTKGNAPTPTIPSACQGEGVTSSNMIILEVVA